MLQSLISISAYARALKLTYSAQTRRVYTLHASRPLRAIVKQGGLYRNLPGSLWCLNPSTGRRWCITHVTRSRYLLADPWHCCRSFTYTVHEHQLPLVSYSSSVPYCWSIIVFLRAVISTCSTPRICACTAMSFIPAHHPLSPQSIHEHA
jgi:hypothetical protein